MSWNKIEEHLFEKYCVEGEDRELCRLMEEHDKEIRDKAIEELLEKLKNFVDCGHLCSPTEPRWTDLSVCEMIDEIAEQMKEVGE